MIAPSGVRNRTGVRAAIPSIGNCLLNHVALPTGWRRQASLVRDGDSPHRGLTSVFYPDSQRLWASRPDIRDCFRRLGFPFVTQEIAAPITKITGHGQQSLSSPSTGNSSDGYYAATPPRPIVSPVTRIDHDICVTYRVNSDASTTSWLRLFRHAGSNQRKIPAPTRNSPWWQRADPGQLGT